MEHGSFGILPADLMTQIVLVSSLRTVASISLSCKYWHNKYKHIFDHNILINQCGYGLISIKNGRVVHCKASYAFTSSTRRIQCLKLGHFQTTTELVTFLKKFNTLLTTEPGPEPEKPLKSVVGEFWMRIQNGDSGEIKYYSLDQKSVGVTVLKSEVVASIYDLIKDSNTQNSDCTLHGSDEKPGWIKIRLFERDPNWLRSSIYYCNICINPQGDVAIYAAIEDCAQEEMYIRTSEEFYQEMKEYIEHSKHKPTDGSKKSDDLTIQGGLFATYIHPNGERYTIAEYEEDDVDGKRTPPKVVARRHDLVRKFAKALELGLYGTKVIQNPHHNNKEVRRLPPTTSVTHAMARRIPYCVDLRGLPQTYRILATILRKTAYRQFDINFYENGAVPLEEIFDLFQFVESNLDLVAAKSGHKVRYQVGNTTPGIRPLQLEVLIQTLSSNKRIEAAKSSVIKRIWSFVEKHFDVNLE